MLPVSAAHWSVTRPVTAEGLIATMDRAGVAKAAVVQAASCYGYDNGYLADAVEAYPNRLTGVACVDVLATHALQRMQELIDRGISGFRLFTANGKGGFDTEILGDARAQDAWAFCERMGASMSLQSGPEGLQDVESLAKKFPALNIVLDHAGRPDVTDGPPYLRAASLFALAPQKNIYLKLTPRTMEQSCKAKATPETLFPTLVVAFGRQRLAWGSNFPASEGGYFENLEIARQCLASLSRDDIEWVFAKTALTLYPRLAFE